MRRTLIAAFLFLAAGAARGETLRLRDGTLLFGEIVSHEESGVRVRRFDTGGMVDLRWHHLTAEEANRLQEAFGYVDREDEGLRVVADRIRIVDGTEVIGILLENRADFFIVRVRENTIQIPTGRIVFPIGKIEVEALAVSTKDQLYDEKRAGADLASASGHLDLARFCARIRDWRRAAEHFRKVKELDPSLNPSEVASKIRASEERAAREKEEEAIDEIRSLKERREFTRALAACERFRTEFPSSAVGKEVEGLRKLVLSKRDEEAKTTVVLGWYEFAGKVAVGRAGERALTLEEAKAFAENEMAKEILKRVLERGKRILPDLDENAARSIWDGRDVGKQRWQRARYDQGTFALGKEKALKGLEQKKEAETKPSDDPQKRELEEKIRRYLRALQTAQGGGAPAKEEEPQAWWDRAPSGARGQWLLAYYGEFGGDMKEVKAWADVCRTCGAKGFIEELASGGGGQGGGQQGGGARGGGQSGGGGVIRRTCPDCHGLQIHRYVTFR